MMTKPLTFHYGRSTGRVQYWAIVTTALLIAVAAPVLACEKSRPAWIASAQSEPITATFTGEFVNGVPVYRFPAITVVTRREAEFAKAQRDGSQAQAARSPSPTPAPRTPKRKVAGATPEADVVKPCMG
jgi:hypothetical protein